MGDSNLIPTRSRAVANRPFERVKAIQAQAESAYQSKIKQLEQDLSDTQQKLNELQRGDNKNQRFILSPEQQAEIKRFYEKKKQVSKELAVVRKQLRKDIDALENRVKWVDIAGMPFLVTAAGVVLAVIKRKKTAAK
jgi:TolA-binding protein